MDRHLRGGSVLEVGDPITFMDLESNRYFLPVTLDPITFQFHCDMG